MMIMIIILYNYIYRIVNIYRIVPLSNPHVDIFAIIIRCHQGMWGRRWSWRQRIFFRFLAHHTLIGGAGVIVHTVLTHPRSRSFTFQTPHDVSGVFAQATVTQPHRTGRLYKRVWCVCVCVCERVWMSIMLVPARKKKNISILKFLWEKNLFIPPKCYTNVLYKYNIIK